MNITAKFTPPISDLRPPGIRAPTQWTLPALIDVLWRRKVIIIAATAAALAMGFAYLLTTAPLYTATAALLPDTRRAPPAPTEIAQEGLIDPAVVESQVETIKSEKIALAVIEKLKLWQDPEFVGPGPGWTTSALIWLGLAEPVSGEVKRRVAVNAFKRKLKILRIGRSYMTEISFISVDPGKAAAIANEVAESYIQDQLGAKFFASQRASGWMQQRIEEQRQQVAAAAAALEEFKRNNGSSNAESAGRLRDLEANAQTQKSLHESMLNRSARLSQFMQQQSFPVTEARVVTEATPPLGPSSPKTALTLLLALFAGGSIGVAGAFAREFLDGSIRDPEHLEQELGVRCFGVLPSIERPHASRLQSFIAKVPGLAGLMSALNAFRRNRPAGAPDAPLRRVKMALDRSGRADGGRSVGIVSPHQSWERASVAVKLATMFARSGQRTLLVDGDLRDASLTRLVSPGLRSGLLGALQIDPPAAEDFKRHELGFDLLGVNTAALQDSYERMVKHDPTDIMQSAAMHELMASLRRRYHYIVVDLPPVLESADAVAAVELFDGLCVVADMKNTTLKNLEHTLKSPEPLLDRLLGIVLIKPAAATLAA